MKNILLTIILGVSFFHAFGQTYTIRGRVTDANTKEPIPFATAYINQTTNGAISGEDGRFEIKFEQQNAEIVISYIGYQPIIYPIDVTQLDQVFVFELAPQTELLSEIEVNAERDESWYYNFETFKRYFLGESKAGRSCEILNDSSLIIIYDQKSRVLTVKAREAIVVENKNLGYQIEYLLENFQYDMRQNYVSFTGYPFFKEMKGGKGKQKRWNKNREKAYLGSSMHFLRSLYNQTIGEEKFVINRLKRIPNPDRPSQSEIDSARRVIRLSANALDLTKHTKERDILNRARAPKIIQMLDASDVNLANYLNCEEQLCEFSFQDYFQVIYQGEKEEFAYLESQRKSFEKMREPTYQTSIISITNEEKHTKVNKFGITTNPLDILYEGYWAFEKIGDMVPIGYHLEE